MSLCIWEHSTRLPREQKMTTSEIGLFFLTAFAGVLWSIVTYTIGYKQGHYEGYQRGKSVGRHISAKSVAE
ncbi:hypothetical protein UFOVP801_14 [uncultured Caudovirales phage]|uniref:Uncharacterized protein n=1 Tax=uncultured Caudovirales phage TaxID=2100421 RepID=A0A6J5P263_9CAUD|nr:hypothetical protein UFOVP801_14 [uncultured Caudovirales phage]